MTRVSYHQRTRRSYWIGEWGKAEKAARAAEDERDELRAELERVKKDSERLDFILDRYRKVVAERLPNKLLVYVEEGFMGDKTYQSFAFTGDWSDKIARAAASRKAIDAAIDASRDGEGGKNV